MTMARQIKERMSSATVNDKKPGVNLEKGRAAGTSGGDSCCGMMPKSMS